MGLLGAITNRAKSEDMYVEKVFNWSEVHLSEMASYKIHTLVYNLKNSQVCGEFYSQKNTIAVFSICFQIRELQLAPGAMDMETSFN